MDEVVRIIGGLAIAAPAGLNAYLPLLVVALGGKFGAIQLGKPYDTLTDWWVIGLLLVLVTVELVADKIPGVDHVNDLINTLIRPAAGALLFLSQNSAYDYINPLIAGILGAVIAGGVHIIKSTARPVVTVTTGGLGNPLVSFFEDLIAAATAILALFAPIVALLILLLFLVPAIWIINRLRKRLAARRAAQTSYPPPPPDAPIQISR